MLQMLVSAGRQVGMHESMGEGISFTPQRLRGYVDSLPFLCDWLCFIAWLIAKRAVTSNEDPLRDMIQNLFF